jgi:hypothetical protein
MCTQQSTGGHAAASRARRGTSLLELTAALGVTTLAAGLCGGALAGLGRATAVESARVRALGVLLAARRSAYAMEGTVEVTAHPGDGALTIRMPDATTRTETLPAGTVITRAPANGRVRFYASCLGDNATFAVGSTDGSAGEQTIVVNQRGLIR